MSALLGRPRVSAALETGTRNPAAKFAPPGHLEATRPPGSRLEAAWKPPGSRLEAAWKSNTEPAPPRARNTQGAGVPLPPRPRRGAKIDIFLHYLLALKGYLCNLGDVHAS